MKNLVTLLVLVFGLTTSIFAQTEKTLVKSIAVKTTASTTSVAMITLPGTVEVTEWDNEFIRITTHLKVENMSENIVKQLVVVGRYEIDSEINTEKGTITILMPKMSHKITVKGVELVETLSFEVNVPEGYEVIVKEENADATI